MSTKFLKHVDDPCFGKSFELIEQCNKCWIKRACSVLYKNMLNKTINYIINADNVFTITEQEGVLEPLSSKQVIISASDKDGSYLLYINLLENNGSGPTLLPGVIVKAEILSAYKPKYWLSVLTGSLLIIIGFFIVYYRIN